MNVSPVNASMNTARAVRLSALDRWVKRNLLASMEKIEHGQITLKDSGEEFTFGTPTPECPLNATITVLSAQFYWDIALRGSLGASESHIAGHWICDDLVKVTRIMIRNQHSLLSMEGGLSRLRLPALKLLQHLNRNTLRGSRKNISAHYDLGNEFFQAFLDKTMTYSSAVFEDDTMSLEDASRAKLERICRKLALRPEHHLLEIGTGWGSFALHAAGEHGCRVTTITISQEQFRLAKDRIREAGLEDRIEVLLEDYRNIEGQFDRVVSIEMIEAVGNENLEQYFRVISERLKPDGMAAIQAILIRDQEHARYLKEVDFIRRHIFPGASLPSTARMMEAVRDSSDMIMCNMEDITSHYVTTLLKWRDQFWKNADTIEKLGYSPEFMRKWDHYLCQCAAGFAENWITTVQAVFAKPLCKENVLFSGIR